MDNRKQEEARDLSQWLIQMRSEMRHFADENDHLLESLDPAFKESARNLLHYLCLRRQDLRPIQQRLTTLGLSSLGRAEANVLCTMDRVLETLTHLTGESGLTENSDELGSESAQQQLDHHTLHLLGDKPNNRNVRIMVTMPSDAASNYQLVHDLVEAGMDCLRINCAHDDTSAWAQMIDNLSRARKALHRPCRIQMDLGGPKLRTCDIHQHLSVLRLKPARDPLGRVTQPARLSLVGNGKEAPLPANFSCARVNATWLNLLASGDIIRLTDARGAHRKWRVCEVLANRVDIETKKTTYLTPGTLLTLKGGDMPATEIIDLPVRDGTLKLFTDDRLTITRLPGRQAVQKSTGCTLPQVFDDVRVGEAILFDDGRIAGVIEEILPERVIVNITRAAPTGSKLGTDKGINLPDSQLNLPALTEKDQCDLKFAIDHADIIGLSFTNSAEDVISLLEHIEATGERRPGIVLKIETRRGFENLPSILLAAMRSQSCGVMIARGDLAVECGFVRLAEVQEEILWLCEAAHVPVIWATQVLESLAKEGMPSRAEITDAAMADRAECVMLNKGPHIRHAVTMLDDILTRMQAHQSKKRAMLRELHVAHRLDT